MTTTKGASRVIKFRAWDKDDKKMYPVRELYQDAVQIENDPASIIGWGLIELMQFTGLHDRNGKEIYEGDILDWSGDRAEVVWSSTGVQWEGEGKYRMTGWYGKVKPGKFETRSLWPLEEGGEVIGNCFENPELLTQQE